MTDTRISSDDARDALDSVEEMQRSGFRRAVKPRWFGLGLSLLVGIGFALYSMEDPGNVPGLLICLGVVLFISLGQTQMGVSGNTFPGTTRGVLAMILVVIKKPNFR